MNILTCMVSFVTQVVTLWMPLVLTLSTIFEINIIYRRTIKGYYETQHFRYQGQKLMDSQDSLAKFHKDMHTVLQNNVLLHRFGLKRIHLCEFWCIYWMLTFVINEQIIPMLQRSGIPITILHVLKVFTPMTLYVYIHERPSHKNCDSLRPWRFPKLFAELYKYQILPLIKAVIGVVKSDITIEKVHSCIKHINGTIGASDFNLFGVESRQIFYFQSNFEATEEPTTLAMANMEVYPDSIIDSTRSSLLSHISPAESIYKGPVVEKHSSKPPQTKRKFATRLNDLFRHKNQCQ